VNQLEDLRGGRQTKKDKKKACRRLNTSAPLASTKEEGDTLAEVLHANNHIKYSETKMFLENPAGLSHSRALKPDMPCLVQCPPSRADPKHFHFRYHGSLPYE